MTNKDFAQNPLGGQKWAQNRPNLGLRPENFQQQKNHYFFHELSVILNKKKTKIFRNLMGPKRHKNGFPLKVVSYTVISVLQITHS